MLKLAAILPDIRLTRPAACALPLVRVPVTLPELQQPITTPVLVTSSAKAAMSAPPLATLTFGKPSPRMVQLTVSNSAKLAVPL